ncbi:Ribonuclease T(2) [Abeliophyllum distichum]|uniref:Ribonuclease T(2) n=1 Tax=Abeliophyllum distichum TaxID=126358 RepID=A0ABD1PMS5_9LAMI
MEQGRTMCQSPIPQRFTIHGLWPCDYNQVVYSYATVTQEEKLLEHHVQGVRDILDHVWPDLYNPEENFKFWSEEWIRHGVESKNGPAYYFQKAIDAKKQVDGEIGDLLDVLYDNPVTGKYNVVFSTFDYYIY